MLNRLQFILLKANWEGTVTRADLIEKFGISPTQATTDFQECKKRFPSSLSYDPSIRRYCPGRAIATYISDYSFDEYYEVVCSKKASAHIIQVQPQAIKPQIYRNINKALSNQLGINIQYCSMNDPEGIKSRTIYPHTLVRSGFRWHVRAFEEQSKKFKDFNIARIKKVINYIDNPSKAAEITNDKAWNEEIYLLLTPNLKLNEAQRKIISNDYTGNEDMVINLQVKVAELLYVLHLYEIRDFSDSPPTTQLLQIGNQKLVNEYLHKS